MVRLSPDQRGAIGIGHSALLIVVYDRVKNLQDLITIVTLTEQRKSKRLSHWKSVKFGGKNFKNYHLTVEGVKSEIEKAKYHQGAKCAGDPQER